MGSGRAGPTSGTAHAKRSREPPTELEHAHAHAGPEPSTAHANRAREPRPANRVPRSASETAILPAVELRSYLVLDIETVPDSSLRWDAARDGFPPPICEDAPSELEVLRTLVTPLAPFIADSIG